MKFYFFFCFLLMAKIMHAGIDDAPDVVMLSDEEQIELTVLEPTVVYATNKGGRRLGIYPQYTKLVLLGMTERAYKVSGKAKHSKVTGWVAPKQLASNEPEFVQLLLDYYKREILVRELIAKKEIAIGMTLDEVRRSIGDPTKKESRITKNGSSGTWEYTESEEFKHYTTHRDLVTGQIYRRFSHVTQEVREQLKLDFEGDIITAISTLENRGANNTRIIVPPLIFGW